LFIFTQSIAGHFNPSFVDWQAFQQTSRSSSIRQKNLNMNKKKQPSERCSTGSGTVDHQFLPDAGIAWAFFICVGYNFARGVA